MGRYTEALNTHVSREQMDLVVRLAAEEATTRAGMARKLLMEGLAARQAADLSKFVDATSGQGRVHG